MPPQTGFFRLAENQIRRDVTLQGKRTKAEKAQDGHFENLDLGQDRHGVDPFGMSPVVPEFPEKAAHEAAEEKGEAIRPVTLFNITQ